jgi:hypothetical protein
MTLSLPCLSGIERPMHRTPDQRMAELQWEAACERLRNALRAPPDRPTDAILSRDEALEVVQRSLAALRRAYGCETVEAEIDRPGVATREDFQKVFSILVELAAEPAESAPLVDTQDYRASDATQQETDLMVALYNNGFVQPTESSSTTGARELTLPMLTADGRDLLDALRNAATWAQVQRMAATQGQTLSLETVKAAVAAALTGGFNS